MSRTETTLEPFLQEGEQSLKPLSSKARQVSSALQEKLRRHHGGARSLTVKYLEILLQLTPAQDYFFINFALLRAPPKYKN